MPDRHTERRLNCSRGHLLFKKIRQIEYLQPMKNIGCKNRPIRDDKVKISPAAVQFISGCLSWRYKCRLYMYSMCVALQQDISRAHRRLLLRSRGTSGVLVINLRSALLQFKFSILDVNVRSDMTITINFSII